MNMDFSIMVICITIGFLALIGSILYVFTKILSPKWERDYKLKEMDIKNKQYDIYLRLSPEAATESINNYVLTYIHNYIKYNFIASKIDYISKDEIEKMVKNVSVLVITDISELYIFYIGLIRTINTDEDLINFVHQKVMELSVEAATEFNRVNKELLLLACKEITKNKFVKD